MFSLSALVISNGTKTGVSKEKQDAYILVKSLRNETLRNDRFIDEVVEVNGIMIEKTIVDYNRNEKLKMLLIVASKGGKRLFESKELIILTVL